VPGFLGWGENKKNKHVGLRTEIISDEVQGLCVVLDFGIEASEVEAIEDVILLDFTKILVSLGGKEPGYPGAALGRMVQYV
jgi:hypothetical protein